MKSTVRFASRGLAVAAFLAAAAASRAGDAVRSFPVPGRPFAIALSADGTTLFVSDSGTAAQRSGVRVFHRNGDSVVAGGFVPLDGVARGVALTPDGSTLLVANDAGLAALDAHALAHDGATDPAYVNDAGAGSIEVAVSRDGAYAFVTEERRNRLAVVRVDRAAAGTVKLSIAGEIPVGRAPVGMALSPDGTRLYVVSEIALRGTSFANAGDAEAVRTRCTRSGAMNGTLTVIDVPKAVAGAHDSVVATFAAGCAPVRVALAPQGDVAWVTARGEDRLLAFDTTKLHDDPDRALIATVSVGTAPVGLAVVGDGALVVVANSNRFSDASASTFDSIDTAKALAHESAVVKSLPAGAFPREFAEAPDGTTLYLTNFQSDFVQIIDVRTLR